MEKPAENRQAGPEDTDNRKIVKSDENRQKHIKEIGPHEHAWVFFGMGADGGRYEVCELCGTRRVANIPLQTAMHADWVEGTGKFEPEKEFEVQAQARGAKAASDDDAEDDKSKAAAKPAHKA